MYFLIVFPKSDANIYPNEELTDPGCTQLKLLLLLPLFLHEQSWGAFCVTTHCLLSSTALSSLDVPETPPRATIMMPTESSSRLALSHPAIPELCWGHASLCIKSPLCYSFPVSLWLLFNLCLPKRRCRLGLLQQSESQDRLWLALPKPRHLQRRWHRCKTALTNSWRLLFLRSFSYCPAERSHGFVPP